VEKLQFNIKSYSLVIRSESHTRLPQAHSIAASAHLPLDALFWCAGSQGSMYPLTGHVQEHVGGVQASTLLTK